MSGASRTRSARLAVLAVVTLVLEGCVSDGTTPAQAGAAGGEGRVDALEVAAEFDDLRLDDLWPGFDPRGTPLAMFDGVRTLLVRHPAPPAEYERVPERADAWSRPGRDPVLVANNVADIAGVPTAAYLLAGARAGPRQLSAAVVHEAFHVFERARHPEWSANEAVLFEYPVDDVEGLALRRLETAALGRALSAEGEPACDAAAALDFRADRFARLPEAAVRYERAAELWEGLAEYVEKRALGDRLDAFPARDFPPEAVRDRAYAIGEALALLLDRWSDDWREQLDAGKSASLDELLASTLVSHPRVGCAPQADELAAARRLAERDLAEFIERRRDLESAFFGRQGWRVEVTAADAEPLAAAGFDPLNVLALGEGRILHRRWLKLTAASGELEVLDGEALTVGAGTHPLFEGISRVTITGLPAPPSIEEDGDRVTVSGGPLRAAFPRGEVDLDPATQTVRLRLGES